MLMTDDSFTFSALDDLFEIVGAAEKKQKTAKLFREIPEKATALVEANDAMTRALDAFNGPAAAANLDLAECDEAEEKLDSLRRRLGKVANTLSPENKRRAEEGIDKTTREIAARREKANATLNRVTYARDEAAKALEAAVENYARCRDALREIDPDAIGGIPQCAAAESAYISYQSTTPWGRFRLLRNEVYDASPHIERLSKTKTILHAQLRIWIGTLRGIQNVMEEAGTEDQWREMNELFHHLHGISREYQPGYIEAFRSDANLDWDAFVKRAKQDLITAQAPDITKF